MIFFDASINLTRHIPRLMARDKDIIVGRYISAHNSSKCLTLVEAKAIQEANEELEKKGGFFKLFLIYEDDGKPRSAATGARAAQVTRDRLRTFGVPQGGLVAFTDDEDLSESYAPGVVAAFEAYFDGLLDHKGDSLVTRGAYGSGALLYKLWTAPGGRMIDVRWPTQSMGFSRSREMIRAGDYEFRQLLNVDFAGIDVDPNVFRTGVTWQQCGMFTPFEPFDTSPAIAATEKKKPGWFARWLTT